MSANSPWSCQYGVLAGLLSPGTRVVVVENAPVRSSSRLQRVIKRALSRRLAAHISVGHSAARELEEIIGLPRGSLATIHNGVPDATEAIRPQGHRSATSVVGMISRIDHLKGVELLVTALQQLPETTVVVVGEGNALWDTRALAVALGVSERLLMPGFDPAARSRLRDFDVFVLPSRMEAFPLSILEAMLAGLPVIATDVGSVAEAVLDGETGILIPPGDIDALVAALRRLLADAQLREQMGSRGRALALERFSAHAMARAYEEVYREITGAASDRSCGSAGACAWR